MSQHHFYTQHDSVITHVLMGWDRPLQGFFMVIEKEKDLDHPFWSNLSETDHPHPRTLNPFLEVLDQLSIAIPTPMIEALLEDQRSNTGNKQVIHRLTSQGYVRIDGMDPGNSIREAYANFA